MKRPDRLLHTFAGDFVEIVTDLSISLIKGDDESVTERNTPYVISGYLLDADSVYVYIGDTPNAVTDMVKKRHIVQIGISRPPDKYEDLLDNFTEEGPGN
jgi:hypothetical protein